MSYWACWPIISNVLRINVKWLICHPKRSPHNVEICFNLATFVFLGTLFVRQCLRYGVFYDTLGIYIHVCSFSRVIYLAYNICFTGQMIFNVHHICAHCYLIECKNWGEKNYCQFTKSVLFNLINAPFWYETICEVHVILQSFGIEFFQRYNKGYY